MNVAEKITTALKGTPEDRAILVQDANRLVAAAVLYSSRLTHAEVEAFAALPTLSEATIRQIASHHEWTRRYGVVVALLRNPRTPVSLAHTLVSQLGIHDLEAVAADAGLPETVRATAHRRLELRSGEPPHSPE